MINKLTLLPLIAITAVTFSTGSASAQCDNNLVRLAHNIEGIAAKLQLEFRTHYAHSSAYRHLISDVSRIRLEAQHIDKLAHNPYSSLQHIRVDLQDLDKLAHHLHAVVDAVGRGRYSGHVDGNTSHVHGLLTSLNGSIHQMEAVVAAYAAPVHHDHYGHGTHGGHHGSHSSHGSSTLGSLLRIVVGGHHGH